MASSQLMGPLLSLLGVITVTTTSPSHVLVLVLRDRCPHQILREFHPSHHTHFPKLRKETLSAWLFSALDVVAQATVVW